jgi:hypothetical protein
MHKKFLMVENVSSEVNLGDPNFWSDNVDFNDPIFHATDGRAYHKMGLALNRSTASVLNISLVDAVRVYVNKNTDHDTSSTYLRRLMYGIF